MKRDIRKSPSFIDYCAAIGIDPAERVDYIERLNFRRRRHSSPVGVMHGLPRVVGTGVKHFASKDASRANARKHSYGRLPSPSLGKRKRAASRKAAAAAIARAHQPQGARRAFMRGSYC